MYIHALSPFISTKYHKLGHRGSIGSCKYSTEKNTENSALEHNIKQLQDERRY